MKIRKQEYGNANMVGRNIERLRKQRGIKQKDFIAKIHRDLKPFTALGEQDKEKDKKIRKED